MAFRNNQNEKGFIPILLTLIAVVAIGIFIFTSGSLGKSFRNLLSGINAPSVIGASTTSSSYNMRVLVIKYFPVTPDGRYINIFVTGDVGDPYPYIRNKTISMTNNLINAIQNGSKYLGYKDTSAQPSLKYTVVDTKEHIQAVPFDPVTRVPLYTKFLNDNNICNYVDNYGVSEVWLWAYQGPAYPGSQYPYLNISESKMSSPFGDISNSFRSNDMPHCKYTYRLYTFNYQRGSGEAIHTWSHQIESEVSAIDNNLFRHLWQGPNYPQTLNVTGRCGSVHNPPNARSEYDWANPNSQNSDCPDWNPDSTGSLTKISCANWGCNTVSDNNNPQYNYIVWNLQNLPGINNSKTYQGKQLRNFWDIHGNWDYIMEFDRNLTLSPVAPPTVNITDSFKRSDSSTLGSSETGQPWVTLGNNSSWGIASGSAYPVNGCPAPGYALLDASASDLQLQVTASVNRQDLIIPFRVVDKNNLYWIEHKGRNNYSIMKSLNGNVVSLAQTGENIASDGDVIKVTLNGTNINLYINGVLKAYATDGDIKGTKFGIGDWCSSDIRFKDFSLTTLQIPSQPPTPSYSPLVPSTPEFPKVYNLLNGENMTLPFLANIVSDPYSSDGKAIILHTTGTAIGNVQTFGITKTVTVRAEAELCKGSPKYTLDVDGKKIMSGFINSTSWVYHTVTHKFQQGNHIVNFTYDNDFINDKCDRNLKLDYISFDD